MCVEQLKTSGSINDSKIPTPIRPVLQAYISLLGRQLPGLMKACFLEGSIALNGFNEQFSDIDFVAVLQRRATPLEVEILRNIHSTIEKNYPRWKMMGSYLQPNHLDGDRFDLEAEPHLYYHDGVLRLHKHFEINSVEGWILKKHGIAINGPEPQDLPFTIDWELLIKKMRENLNSYWVSWTKQPNRIVILLSDWGIQWAVLGVLRQFYSFRENAITTKTKAGEYALTCVPTRWHQLIQEAINIREGRAASSYRFRLVRMIETVRFLKIMVQTCNTNFT